MGTLKEFQSLISEIDDEKLLQVAESLLKDMLQIENMKEKIEMLDDALSKGDRAAFYFFAVGLDKEQLDLATNAVIGRQRQMKDKAGHIKAVEDSKKPIVEVDDNLLSDNLLLE